MAGSVGCGSYWWDREVDGAGKVIRADVRQAGHAIWQAARRKARLNCGDEVDAGWLMESAVERVSRYLDRKAQPLFSKDVRWLLLTTFRRLLRRHTKRLERLKLVGDVSNLPELKSQDDWVVRANMRVDLTKILRRLSPRTFTILVLRLAGFEWREIGRRLHLGGVAARRSFWREIKRVQNVGIRKP